MRLSYLRHPLKSMKSQFDLVISSICSTVRAILCWVGVVADHLPQIRLRGRADCGDTLCQGGGKGNECGRLLYLEAGILYSCVSKTEKLDSMTRFGVVPDIF